MENISEETVMEMLSENIALGIVIGNKLFIALSKKKKLSILLRMTLKILLDKLYIVT